jgi:hypothetical protein
MEELLAGLLGALVGTAAGGLAAYLTSRAQMRRELEYAYDRDLRARRVEAYVSLYRRTATSRVTGGRIPRGQS